MCACSFVIFFCCKQMTAYEMRISDWSSDVCSSDLYSRYLGDYYTAQYQRLPAWMRSAVIAPLVQAMPSDRHGRLSSVARYARTFVASNDLPFEERYRSYVQVFGQESLDRLLKEARAGRIDGLQEAFALARGGDGLNRLMRVDLMTQLPNDLLMLTDKMTMARSLECRVPLLNHELVELAARVPAALRIDGRSLKSLMKRALDGILPPEILERRKRGFGAPIGAWLKRDLQPMLLRLLSKQAVERRGLFSWPAIEETMALHFASREDHTDHLLARSEEHTSELQSLMRISYAVSCLKKKKNKN